MLTVKAQITVISITRKPQQSENTIIKFIRTCTTRQSNTNYGNSCISAALNSSQDKSVISLKPLMVNEAPSEENLEGLYRVAIIIVYNYAWQAKQSNNKRHAANEIGLQQLRSFATF